MYPEWLPAPLQLNGASVDDDYRTLNEVFNSSILGANLKIEGVTIIVNADPDREMPQYAGGLMHLVTRKNGSGQRVIDYERAKKLHWIPAIITNYQKSDVKSFWHNSPKGEVLYLWLHEHDHMVVLKWTSRARRRKIIVTSFCIDSFNRDYYERLYTQAVRILQ